ncbi:hypothetical protein SPAN111604_13385 [Sphingomonas antarctica]|uniref:hypothetical protein n=1 Tax=Sphingomonas antarctica TaxID=2040274 RepID=UPI0039ED8E5A
MSEDYETRLKWSRALKDRFIAAIYERGSIKGALAATGLARNSAYRQKRLDPVFADDWTRAANASQERVFDDAVDETHNGVEVEIVRPDGTVEVRRQPVSERTRAIVLTAAAKATGAYQAAREANPDADAAARQRVRIGLLALAKHLGMLF